MSMQAAIGAVQMSAGGVPHHNKNSSSAKPPGKGVLTYDKITVIGQEISKMDHKRSINPYCQAPGSNGIGALYTGLFTRMRCKNGAAHPSFNPAPNRNHADLV